AGNGNAQPGTACFPMRDKGLEQSWEHLGRNTDASIGNAKHDLILNQIGSDRENSAARHGFARILHQTGEHTNETGAIDLDIAVVTNVFNKVDILARKQSQRLLIQLVEQSP